MKKNIYAHKQFLDYLEKSNELFTLRKRELELKLELISLGLLIQTTEAQLQENTKEQEKSMSDIEWEDYQVNDKAIH